MRKNVIFDAMRGIDPKYIEAAAPREKSKAAPRQWRAIVAAACLLLVAVAALPAVIKLKDVIVRSMEYSRLEDIPGVEDIGIFSFSGYIRVPPYGSTVEDVDEEKIEKFLNIKDEDLKSEFSERIKKLMALATYDPNGDFYSISVKFFVGDEEVEDLFAIVEPGDKIDESAYIDQTVMVNGYTVRKKVYYPGRDYITGEPHRDNGYALIYMSKEEVTVMLAADIKRLEELETVYNYMLNMDFDFEALK